MNIPLLFLISRTMLFIFNYIIYGTELVKKYDLSQNIFANTYIENQSYIEKSILNLLCFYSAYDGTYFGIISSLGYVNEHMFAFYPLYPYLSRIFSYPFKFFNFKNYFTPYLIGGFLCSNFLCLFNCFLLHKLIFLLTNSKFKSNISVFLFLFNPGSIFYMALYSENLYFTLELLLILILMKDSQNWFDYILLCIITFLINLTRSNGIIVLSFVIIPIFVKLFKQQINLYNDSFINNLINLSSFIKNNFLFILKYVILAILGFISFNWNLNIRAKSKICKYISQNINSHKNQFHHLNLICNNKKNEFNNIYNYIQKYYWGVTIFNQYKKQYIHKHFYGLVSNSFGFYIVFKSFSLFNYKELYKLNLINFLISKKDDKENKNNKFIQKITDDEIKRNAFILGGIINFFILFVTVLIIAYITISNRLYCGHPLLYFWLVEDVYEYIQTGKNKKGFLIILFFITFSFVSCLFQIGSFDFM